MTTMRCSAPFADHAAPGSAGPPRVGPGPGHGLRGAGPRPGPMGSDAADYVGRINAPAGLGRRRAPCRSTASSRPPPRSGPTTWPPPAPWPTPPTSPPGISRALDSSWARTSASGPSNTAIWPAFVASAHHYANIVDPDFNRVGVGVAYARRPAVDLPPVHAGRRRIRRRRLRSRRRRRARNRQPKPRPAAPAGSDDDHHRTTGRDPRAVGAGRPAAAPVRAAPARRFGPGGHGPVRPAAAVDLIHPDPGPVRAAGSDGSGGSGPHWAHGHRHRDPRAEPQLRQRPRPRRAQPRGRAGRGAGAARPQRRRQDHDRPAAQRRAHPRPRLGPGARLRPGGRG